MVTNIPMRRERQNLATAAQPESMLDKLGIRISSNSPDAHSDDEARQMTLDELQQAEAKVRHLEGWFGISHPEVMEARRELDIHREMTMTIIAVAAGELVVEPPDYLVATTVV